MALVGLLITVAIALIYFFFFHLGPADKPQLQPQNIESNAQNAVNKAIDSKRLEMDQVNNIDEP